MLRFYSGILFFSISLFSCGTRNAQFVSQVEELEETIQKAQQSIVTIDTSKIGNALRISTGNLKFIQENFKDTMDKETAFLMSDYSASRKSLKRLLENYSDVIRELSYSQSQLANLKLDVENNVMEEQKFNDYYSSESKSVEKLDEYAKNIVEWYASALRMYEEKNSAVEKIVGQLNAKLTN